MSETYSGLHSSVSPVRSDIDVIAYAVHTLGFWPEKSVVLVAMGDKHTGPVIRISVDSLGVPDTRIEQVLSRYLSVMPDRLEGEPLGNFFTLIFGGGNLRARQLNPRTFIQPSLQEIERDAREAGKLTGWIRGSALAAQHGHKRLVDVFYVGGVSRYGMGEDDRRFMFSGFVDDVLKSSLYLDLLARGSVVTRREKDAFEVHSFDALASRKVAEATAWGRESRMWFEQYRRAVDRDGDYCSDFLSQKYAEATLWNTALDSVQKQLESIHGGVGNRVGDADYADCVRDTVPAQVAGFLAATLNSQASAQFVLFTAGESLEALASLMEALGEGAASKSACAEAAPQELPVLYLPAALSGDGIFVGCLTELIQHPRFFTGQKPGVEKDPPRRFAQMLTGRSRKAPHWGRLFAVDCMISVLAIFADSEQLGRLFQIQAWMSWFRGNGSRSHHLLLRAKEHLPFEESPLSVVLDNSLLPLWAGEPEQCWRSDRWSKGTV